jgi:exodeoxyribonuclease VIII
MLKPDKHGAFNANASPGAVGTVEPQNFSAHIEPQSCLDLGMTVAWSTIAWWLQQPEAARMEMVRADTAMHLAEALIVLKRWLEAVSGGNSKELFVWGHGATFDISLLEDAYRRCKLPVPWHYRNVRDLRTLRALAPPDLVLTAPSAEGNLHVAVDDAIMQAAWITQCTAALRSGQSPVN